jgi:hypothetical protein
MGDLGRKAPIRDTFKFDLAAVLSTHLEAGIVDQAIDFNQSNSGNFNGIEGDTSFSQHCQRALSRPSF